jgi:hypothetical protein
VRAKLVSIFKHIFALRRAHRIRHEGLMAVLAFLESCSRKVGRAQLAAAPSACTSRPEALPLCRPCSLKTKLVFAITSLMQI